MHGELCQGQAVPQEDVASFEDWVINQFGEKLFSIFFKTYTEKVWGMDTGDISADWAAQRIKGLSLGAAVLDGLKRSLGLHKRKNDGMAVKTLLETFRYPRQGPGMMWEAARDFIVARGNPILMGHSLQQLSYDPVTSRWRVAATTPDGKTMTINAVHVISSAPIRELVSRIHPLPQSVSNAFDPQISRFPHRRADDPLGGFVPGQLDLHPRSPGEGRPGAEFPQLVAGDGA